jgi:hypothetical protein
VNKQTRFYVAQDGLRGTHLALYWKGKLRYTVPRDAVGQQACWKFFQPGRLGIPMRAMASLPRLLNSALCVEADNLNTIREAIGKEAGASCCRAGALLSKDTILLLKKENAEPLYVVKTGVGATVGGLLQNEADWLSLLREQPALSSHIPELVQYRSWEEFTFVAQSPLPGELDFKLEKPQFEFLAKLQKYSARRIQYEESRLCRNIKSRFTELSGLLSEEWTTRIARSMRRMSEVLSDSKVLTVAAHNDFTPWNIRMQNDRACVFDWEYASSEELPLFDPLHFELTQMALRSERPAKLIKKIDETTQLCRQWFGKELCVKPDTQALAYMINLCTRYLWIVKGKYGTHPILDTYAKVIDQMLPM